MGFLKNSVKALFCAGGAILGLSGFAHAGGTTAGTNVQITYTLDYQVGGVQQDTIDTSASGSNTPVEFTVDRRIDLTVSSLGNVAVVPGEQDADLVFRLTNDGNDTQAYALSAVNEAGDDFSADNRTLFYYVDDGDNAFEPDADDGSAVAYNGSETPDLAKDRVLFIVVRADIPSNAPDDGEDDISVVADTLEPSTAASPGTPVTADLDGNQQQGAAENVLADGSGTSNENNNEGDHSATSRFVVDDPLIVKNVNDNGAGTLRAAITHANAYTDADAITFAIPGAGPHVITLLSQLPTITDDGVSIDGTTQSGASCGQLTTGTQHTLRVQLDGTNAGANTAGIESTATGVVIKGLAIVNFDSDALTISLGTNSAVLECLYVGVETDGVTKANNSASDLSNQAITIVDADNVTLRNSLVSGHDDDASDRGVRIARVNGATVEGNIIGLDASGSTILGNANLGIRVNSTSTNVTIGGTTAEARNVISGNGDSGLSTSGETIILGNYIGLSRDGSTAVANSASGIEIEDASNVTIGNGTAAGRNVISGNAERGIFVNNGGADIVIDNNYIGLSADGSTALGNGSANGTDSVNVFVEFGTITGALEIKNNVISGGAYSGIYLRDVTVDGAEITDNMIGVNPAGTAAMANQFGVTLHAPSGGITNALLHDNVISGNTDYGINVATNVTNLSIKGNHIGVNESGSAAIPNGGAGLLTGSSTGLTIGGTNASDRNIISGNGAAGIVMTGTSDADILGNYIGLNAAGLSSVANTLQGIRLSNADDIEIGDGTSGGRNYISGNLTRGLQSENSTNIVVTGNSIGLNTAGSAVGNGGNGINVIGVSTVAIYVNNIFDNGGLGIELNDDGLTANDNGDGDTGPNDLLNFPVINTITASGSTSVMYNVNLDVPANTEGYRIEFYKNSAGDASGHGEGETFLGFVDTGNHAGGSVNFDGTFTATEIVSSGDIISTTATRKTGATSYDITSEFSQNYTVVSALVVTNTNDSGAGSLRQAIENANASTSMDDITFAIPGAGPHVITLASALPNVTDDGVTIDGTSQSGAGCGNLWGGTPHNLKIQIDGNGGNFILAILEGDNTTLKGVSLTGATTGDLGLAFYAHVNSSNVSLTCSYVGLAPDGTIDANNYGVASRGANTIFGGPNPDDGNVISGNLIDGISQALDATNLSIEGNFIGTDPLGLDARPNGRYGLGSGYVLQSAMTWNAIRKNLISGNGSHGILTHPDHPVSGSSGDVVFAGNYIGVDRTGNTALPNGGDGIHFEDGSISGVTIGGSTVADRNIISGNTDRGINLTGVDDVDIFGNYIGLGADGTTDVGNGRQGIIANNVDNFIIGNGTAAGRNVISGNVDEGVDISASMTVSVRGNYFGTDHTGNSAVHNDEYALDFSNVNDVQVGGSATGDRNVMTSATWIMGVDQGDDITIENNWLGVGANGTSALPSNSDPALWLWGTGGQLSNVTVQDNVIVNGGGNGVDINSGTNSVTNLTLMGNNIGVLPNGTTAAGNSSYGIRVYGAAVSGTVFTDNIISHSGNHGISVEGANKAVAIYGNRIFSNTGLGIDLVGGSETNSVTANDNGDGDTGPNDLLNFPVINMFSGVGTSLSYDITLDAPSNANGYRVEFYKNSSADASGHGEGETFLGFIDTGNHAGGAQTFTGTFTGTETANEGAIIAATATRKTGPASYDITSEFSLTYSSGSPTELEASKAVTVFDPLSQELYAIPGNDVIHSITVTNPGGAAADTDSIVIIDQIPSEVTFYNGDIDDGGPETNPVSFSQTGGAGLSFTYGADAKYSNSGVRPSNMAACTYTPSAGYDVNVTYICLNPKGAMQPGNPDPTFTLSYRARIK